MNERDITHLVQRLDKLRDRTLELELDGLRVWNKFEGFTFSLLAAFGVVAVAISYTWSHPFNAVKVERCQGRKYQETPSPVESTHCYPDVEHQE